MLWVWPKILIGLRIFSIFLDLLGHTPADPCEARDEVNPIALLQVHQPLHLKGL